MEFADVERAMETVGLWLSKNAKIICDSSFVIGNYFVTLRR